jgi:hypothetical protein
MERSLPSAGAGWNNQGDDQFSEAANTAPGLIAAGKTLQKLETPYATAVAVQKPRSMVEVRRRCIEEATLAGEDCFYGWGGGKDRVEGPSIICAMIAVRNFGNCYVGPRTPVQETEESFIFSSAFVDLETGFTYERQFMQSKKWTIYGKMDEARKSDVRFQIGQSKADRNVILRSMPGWLIDAMMEKAKAGVRERIEKYVKEHSIEAARKYALDALAKFSVKLDRIEWKYGVKYAEWNIDILTQLAGDVNALMKGMESADTLFPVPEKQPPVVGKLDLTTAKPGTPDQHQPVSGSAPPADPQKRHRATKAQMEARRAAEAAGNQPPPTEPAVEPEGNGEDHNAELEELSKLIGAISEIAKIPQSEVQALLKQEYEETAGSAMQFLYQLLPYAQDWWDGIQAEQQKQQNQTSLV